MACLYKVKWSSHLQSQMRACRVVHFNSPCNSRLSLFKAEYAVIKDPFVFQCVVHALGKCIVKRITVLCHANAISLEKSHISFGSILTTSVRVMNQSFGVYGMLLIETHCGILAFTPLFRGRVKGLLFQVSVPSPSLKVRI